MKRIFNTHSLMFIAIFAIASYGSAALVSITGQERWDGIANPHAADGVTLTVQQADQLNINDLNLGDDSTVDSNLYVRGIIRPGSSVGSATVDGTLIMDDEADPIVTGYHVELEDAGNNLLTVGNGEVHLVGTLTVEALNDPEDPEDYPMGVIARTIITVPEGGEWNIFGEFTTVPPVGTFSEGPPVDWTPGEYLGNGVWFGDDRNPDPDQNGVIYVDRAGDPDVSPASRVDIVVFQAEAGDANGNHGRGTS